MLADKIGRTSILSILFTIRAFYSENDPRQSAFIRGKVIS
jgi:hypothetical protein